MPHSEGHPMPNYDRPTAREIQDCELEALEMELIIAAIDYCSQYVQFPKEQASSTAAMRAWGNENYILHRKLIEAAEKLKTLEVV